MCYFYPFTLIFFMIEMVLQFYVQLHLTSNFLPILTQFYYHIIRIMCGFHF
jgi:hypothetical protein